MTANQFFAVFLSGMSIGMAVAVLVFAAVSGWRK